LVGSPLGAGCDFAWASACFFIFSASACFFFCSIAFGDLSPIGHLL